MSWNSVSRKSAPRSSSKKLNGLLNGAAEMFVHVVVPEQVEVDNLGFKMKWKFGKCVVYDVKEGSMGMRQGLKVGHVLLVAGGTPMTDESLFTKKLIHDTRPLELIFE